MLFNQRFNSLTLSQNQRTYYTESDDDVNKFKEVF